MSTVFESMMTIVEEDAKARRLRKEQALFKDMVHEGITCNDCGKIPLLGVRYQSLKDASKSLCMQCESVSNSSDIYLKIKEPVIGDKTEEITR